jgi:hypothetical protein
MLRASAPTARVCRTSGGEVAPIAFAASAILSAHAARVLTRDADGSP